MLYQLSYRSGTSFKDLVTFCRNWGLNPGPTAYKAGALPLSYSGSTHGGGRTHDLPLRRRTRYPLRYAGYVNFNEINNSYTDCGARTRDIGLKRPTLLPTELNRFCHKGVYEEWDSNP